ncbi:ATP-binding protein [Dorea acetigenes]|uniref:ATP-binding protein n=1 Tax=Dorea acetigenes TaxID=2981787 RepID=A0ABT2RS23_9FIRM|nr:AAA family ATPase [Dorea acetigenes]MCU6688183.1 ATP-binding protein [Dorea acetigenes]SCJ68313.1 Predicted ATPase [uncultured Clostridium sp.]
MKQNVIRLVAIEINNIKNVKYGRLELSKSRKGSILGIYGQNGSGKTVVVDCMVLLKCLFSGKKIPSHFYYYINSQSETAQVKYCFEIRTDYGESYAEYEIGLLKNGESSFCINKEKLSVRECVEGKATRLTPVFDYQKGEKELFRLRKYYSYFENKKNMENMVALGIAQQATENYNEEKQRPEVGSFLFSKKAQDVFAQAEDEVKKVFRFSSMLQNYGMYNLAVIENEHYALLALNLDMIPVNIGWPDSIKSRITGIMLRLTDINVVPKEIYPYVANTIEQINIVMKALIPEIQLEIYNAFDKLMENGKDGIQFEIITLRDGARIPLLYESAGIKKLISICSNLVACYNQESYCLVVDEVDSGIYEYLLGECLEVMQEKAKGQLIFTSHNLRPLEVLENEFLIYTTVNPENRYIKSAYIKNTQNTRLSYLRSIKLGGQKEKLYNETNIYEMELAMRRAGRVGIHE